LEILKAGESNDILPLGTCLECSVPEPYRSPDWALVLAKTVPKRLNTNDVDDGTSNLVKYKVVSNCIIHFYITFTFSFLL
jgi:hypothetical protein